MSHSDHGTAVEAKSKNEIIPAPKGASEESELKHSIKTAIENFIGNIEGLREIAPFLEVITLAIVSSHRKDIESERDRFGTIISEKDGRQAVRFPPERASQALKMIRKLQNVEAAQKALPNMFLLAIVSQFDAFITDLLKSLFKAKPELVFTSDKQISFSDLSQFSSLDEARDSIIEKAVEAIVRQSHEKQFDKLENLFGVNLREGLDVWPKFIEITERRNLLAHTNGVVSTQYVNVCRRNEISENEIPNVGERLSFPPDYLENSLNVLF